MTAVPLCSCNYAEKIPACRGKASMMGKIVGTEPYCKKCGKPLSMKDVDTFGYELGLRD